MSIQSLNKKDNLRRQSLDKHSRGELREKRIELRPLVPAIKVGGLWEYVDYFIIDTVNNTLAKACLTF